MKTILNRRNLLLVLGIMIGMAGYGQISNDDLLNPYYPNPYANDDIFFKGKGIKSLTNIYYGWDTVVSKQITTFDSSGNILMWYSKDEMDSARYNSKRNYITKQNIQTIIDSSMIEIGNFNRKNVVTIYYNAKSKDSLKIDSVYDEGKFSWGYITCYEYDKFNNLIKDSSRYFPSDHFHETTEYFYDSQNRLIKDIFIQDNYPPKSIGYDTYKYSKNKIVYASYGNGKFLGDRTFFFDNKNRLVKIKKSNFEWGIGQSLFYEGNNLIREEYPNGAKIEYFYKDNLPIKKVRSVKGQKPEVTEYLYEFY